MMSPRPHLAACTRTPLTALLVLVGLAGAASCSQASSTPAEATAPAPKATTPAGPVGDILTHTEALRALLADDTLAGTRAHIEALKAAGTALAADATKKAEGEALVIAADAMASNLAQNDIKAARVSYGEVNRAVVGLIAKDTSLQTGRFLFECPMAKGYQRWVQTSPKMANPYMGKRMLECGSTIEPWKVEG